ncbi:Gfo/Idh/MocA family oxidoreductase [Pedobacter sp. Du54]|uniref:Gfo/Idh/MocA family protein n=1 Tax=Pedobacter anseongensis TaxID=3133439 RepID=UPI0030B599A6
MQEVRWGIIGCGNVTEVKSGPAFNKVANSKLVAVMRRNGAKAKDYAERHGVEKWYDNAQQLINDPAVNAIYIATPPSSHLFYTLSAIEAGKPVYVEKPMSLNFAEANEMYLAAKKANVKLVVAHYRRAQPMFLKIKALLDDKTIGDVRFVQLQLFQPQVKSIVAPSEENWRINPALSGGGLFHDLAPHQLDLMLYFFSEVKDQKGFSVNSAKTSAADDIVTGQLLFENGILFNGTWCFSVADDHSLDRCEIFGSKGKITFAIFGNQLEITVNGETEIVDFEPLQHVQEPMIAKVVDYFLNRGDNPCDGETAAKTMMVMDSFTRLN